jgi:hypothetical protein
LTSGRQSKRRGNSCFPYPTFAGDENQPAFEQVEQN